MNDFENNNKRQIIFMVDCIKNIFCDHTLSDVTSRLGFNNANFAAAASIDFAALFNSFSAMNVGSLGSTQSPSFRACALFANSETATAI